MYSKPKKIMVTLQRLDAMGSSYRLTNKPPKLSVT
jgi:hypothetical protein